MIEKAQVSTDWGMLGTPGVHVYYVAYPKRLLSLEIIMFFYSFHLDISNKCCIMVEAKSF